MIPRLQDLKMEAGFTAAAFRVYLYMVEELSPVEYREKSPAELAARASLPEDAVRDGLEQLVAGAYLDRVLIDDVLLFRLVWRRPTGPTQEEGAAELGDPFYQKLLAERRSKASKRRARKLAAPGDGITSVQWAEILAASLGICAYCHERLPLTLDHVDPLARGGAHDPDNAVAACLQCNSSKHTTPLVLWLARRATRAAGAACTN